MSWTPTDEQVEKVARAGFEFDERVRVEFGHQEEPLSLDDLPGWGQQTHREKARAVLVAVGPMIAAGALRGFADGWVADLSAELVGRTMLKTAMHDRADVYMSQIEKEAGR